MNVPHGRPRRTTGVVVATLLGTGALAAVGAWVPAVPTATVVLVAGAAACVAVVLGIARHRPRPATGWWCVALAVLVWAGGTAAASGAVRLVGVAALALGLVVLARAGRVRRHPTATLDAAIVGVGLGALVWMVLLTTGAPGGTAGVGATPATPAAAILGAALPAAHVVLLALVARLATAPGAPGGPTLLLGSAVVAATLSEAADLLPAAAPPLAVVALGLVAASATHPAMATLVATEAGAVPSGPLGTAVSLRDVRLVGLALLVVPALLVARLFAGAGPEVWAAVVAGTLLAGLVVLRTVRVARWGEEVGLAASTDLTTGLPGRSRVEGELPRLLAAHPGGMTVLVLDVDRFNEVNATFGHDVGDRALRAVGELLRTTVRDAPDALVGRLGGDEFVLVLPGTGPQVLGGAARDLRRAFSTPVDVDGLDLRLGVSIGLASAPDDGTDPATLLRRADVALARAKRERARIARYEHRTDARSTLGGSLARDLVDAVADEQLRLHVQPILAMPGREVVGIEALVRWQHPEHGLLGPDTFVPAAERTGSIGLLTRWVLDRSLAAVVDLRDEAPGLRVSVNISATSLRDHQVVRDVRAALERHGLPGHVLRLEVTETSAMADPERAVDVLHALTDVGVGLALDDYGTGYCSLAYLQRLPVDQLKLDRAFVGRMSEHEPSEAIVRSTIDLGHRLGLSVVAEGVEDEVTVAMLDAMGCRRAQGFGLARPVPVEDARSLLVPRVGAGGAARHPAGSAPPSRAGRPAVR